MKWLTWPAGRRNGAHKGARPLAVQAPVLDGVAFERELQRQRAFCDRTDGRFVLMVFSVARADALTPGRTPVETLARVVSERARLSDVAGVYGAGGDRIGVILADTDGVGAEQFLRSVEQLVRGRLNGSWTPDLRLRCEVFPYPERISAVAPARGETAPTAGPVKTQ